MLFFVPEWGWVGSGLTSVTAALIKVFSSPSGDGLVHNYCPNCGAKMEFSSPSGDGLVRDYALSEKNIVNDFRPRVGMGWFNFNFKRWNYYENFRPRVGMGWFDEILSG